MSDTNMHEAAHDAETAFNEGTQSAQAALGAGGKKFQEMMSGAQSMFGMEPAKMTEAFRAMTQKSVEQSKEAYARMKSAAEDATKTLESTMEHAHQGSMTLSKKAIEALRVNAETSFTHLEKLMTAKSFSEVIELQTSYVRKQIELATDQAKDMQSVSQSIAQEMLKPGREALQKATETARQF